MSALATEFAPRVRYREPMSRHTSWHVGGPADIYFNPRDRADLSAFLQQLDPQLPLYWVGLGSNLLVRDGGLRGVVIVTQDAFNRCEQRSDTELYCEAGVPCARLAKQCVKWQMGPAEFLVGIPGTLGGALAMNAGAYGGETWQHVVSVETINRTGELQLRQAHEYRVSYRHVAAPQAHEWFLSATLRFEHRPDSSDQALRELLERRKASQPIGEWNCGSVFVNPPGDHAARLIESAGLKGYRLGDASVSSKHANFIINHGQARAADIEQLIRHVQATVEQQHGIKLHTEVRIVGESH
jgi:UDP-N-acetylmuramate dehydrogenase